MILRFDAEDASSFVSGRFAWAPRPCSPESVAGTPSGFFSFRGREYRLGVGMAGHRVVIAQAELGMRLSFQGFDLPYLHEL